MPWTLCLPRGTDFLQTRDRICVEIPELINPDWKDLNPPGPRIIIDQQRLQQWAIVEGEAIPQLMDLPILATMNMLATQVSDERLRQQLTQTMQQVTQEVSGQLPEGVSLEAFDESKAAAD